jgi:hypothetical protein
MLQDGRTTTITASAAGCNGPVTTTHVTTVTPTVTIGSFFSSDTITRQGAGIETRTTIGTNTTGITYTLMLLLSEETALLQGQELLL